MPLLKLLFSFRGRIGRLAYWAGSLINLTGWYINVLLIVFIGRMAAQARDTAPKVLLGWALFCIALAVLLIWINLAISAKRFHDRGKSAWRFLIVLVPLVGTTWLFIELGCLPGTLVANRYGPPPGPAPDGTSFGRRSLLR